MNNKITTSGYNVREQTREPGEGIWHDGCMFSADWPVLIALDGDGYDLEPGESLDVRYTIREIERTDSDGDTCYEQMTDAEQATIVAALTEALPEATVRKHYDGEVTVTVTVIGADVS